MPHAVELGVSLQAASRESVTATMPYAERHTTLGGALHGGALMAFADSIGAVCAFLNLPEGAGTSTIESKTNFLRGVTSGAVSGRAQPVHVGRRTIVVQTELRDDAGKLVALTTQTQAVLT
ncbi:MAG: PaaI family thioesterase [Acidimicrobiia bacterium]|nr:PaaI family thioesterase [Acidimicrobiia bacterium]